MRPPSLLCGCAAEKGGAKSSSELGLSLWIFGCTFSMAADELIAYIVEGILPVPAFCASTQNELLAGFEVSAFVGECVEKSETGRVSRLELEEAYISWCARHDIPVGLAKIQMPGYDEYAQVNFRQGLSEKEKRALFKGMRVYGFEEKTVHGTRYFSCVLKK